MVLQVVEVIEVVIVVVIFVVALVQRSISSRSGDCCRFCICSGGRSSC